MSSGSTNSEKPIAVPRRVSALLTYLHPFRLVQSDTLSEWKSTIEEINGYGWDYIKLHEIAGGIDVGLPPPYHLLVGRDESLALPPIPKLLGDQEVVEFFNRCLAALLLGGVYCEAITLDDLEFGSVIDWKYLRVSGRGRSAANRFHLLIRQRQAPPLEAIALLDPRTERLTTLRDAMAIGLAVLSDVPSLSAEFLLKGVSGIARRDWSAALSNLWIVIEQITAFLWEREILSPLSAGTVIPGRRDQLRDSRAWSAANRQELLHQKGVIDASLLQNLYTARKTRNELMHTGAHPDEKSARAAYSAVLGLISAALNGRQVPLFNTNLDDHSLSDPFKPVKSGPIDPQYWLPIPKLPGEEELEREEAKSMTR